MKNLHVYDKALESKKYKIDEQQKLRNLHLRKIALGEVFEPFTGKPSIDKKWLRYYSEEQIMAEMPEMTIYDYMMKNNQKNKNETALIYFGNKISFKQLEKAIDNCAKGMIKNGIKEDDIVTICMPNTPEAVIAFYALNKIGAVANMIHPLSGQNEIKRYLSEVNSKMIITMDMAYEKVLNIVDQTKVEKIVAVSASDSMPFALKKLYPLSKESIKLKKHEKTIKWNELIKDGKKDKKKLKPSEYKKNKLSVILHTGGTTGTPKGVMLTDDNFNCMVEQFLINENNFKRGDKMLTIMPVFHGFGLCSSIHLPLSVGVTAILVPKLGAKKHQLDELLKKYKPNHLIGVPTLFKAMMKNKKMANMDMSYLKYVVSGGDLVKDALESDINDFLREHNANVKLSKGYGLSEAVAGVTFASNGYNKENSIGIPMVATNIKIVKKGTEEEVKENEVGEICIQGPTTTIGYYNNEKETKETLKDGWLHTGDLGYCDNGIFYFNQRKGNMIISSGVNVYPSNIEKVIESHEAVESCAVIGIHHSYKIQVPKAYIILKEGYEATEELKNELEHLCKKNLNVYSVPYSYEFREKLPQTLLGKISHKQLEEEERIKTYSKKK